MYLQSNTAAVFVVISAQSQIERQFILFSSVKERTPWSASQLTMHGSITLFNCHCREAHKNSGIRVILKAQENNEVIITLQQFEQTVGHNSKD